VETRGARVYVLVGEGIEVEVRVGGAGEVKVKRD
jgi:hypothetical protein